MRRGCQGGGGGQAEDDAFARQPWEMLREPSPRTPVSRGENFCICEGKS